MAKKPAQPDQPAPPVENDDHTEIIVYPAARAAIPNPLDEVLSAYDLPANTLRVEVLRSHDRLYEGQIVYLPNDDRTAGLISGGFVQLVPPTILGVETYR